VGWYQFTSVSDVCTASIIKTSETLVDSPQAMRHCNTEDGHLRIHRRENLKYYLESDFQNIVFASEEETFRKV
jgi:hypothetical protein